MTLLLKIITPAGIFMSEPVERATFVAAEGQAGIGAGHEPSIFMLKPCLMTIKPHAQNSAGGAKYVFVDGGVMRVDHEHALLISEEALSLSSITLEAVTQELQSYFLALSDADEPYEIQRIEHLVERTQALIKAKELVNRSRHNT